MIDKEAVSLPTRDLLSNMLLAQLLEINVRTVFEILDNILIYQMCLSIILAFD
jgi:hypothetical protein